MRVLVTRPAVDAEPFAAALRGIGVEPVLAPLLTIEPVEAAIELDGVAALVFTSANGARAFARLNAERGLPVFAVGDATMRAATEAGFGDVRSAGADVEALAALIARTLDPLEGAIYHAAGRDVAGDLKTRLESAGFSVRREILYRARAADRLDPAAVAAISAGNINGVALFSPRTAASFVSLAETAGLEQKLSEMCVFCLSAAVAAEVGRLRWAEIHVAARPTQDALLNAIRQVSTAG